jgi:acyl-CoA synthetase (NDP forming)
MSDLISDKLYPLNATQISQFSEVLPHNWSKNNPVDIIGDATSERYLQALKAADRFGVDTIYILVTPQFMTDTEKICQLFCENRFKTPPMFPVLLGGPRMEKAKILLRKNKIVFFEELTEAVSFF